jgi:hypothetical protein
VGGLSYLTGGANQSPQSVEESIFQLQNTSVVFVASWLKIPKDHRRAARVSQEAMVYLDHIVNEILRQRDVLKATGSYVNSSLETELNKEVALFSDNITRSHQMMLSNVGAGNGALPTQGFPLKMEKLLNKIKHRRRDLANFRVDASKEHFFIITVDKPNLQPDCIVEFSVINFCEHCSLISAIL